MTHTIEMNLSRLVNVTNTRFIRSSVRSLIERDNLDGPPVELVRFHVVIHCTAGSGWHMVDFENHEVGPGTIIWIRPGQVQRWADINQGFDADVAVFESSSIPDLPLFDRFLGATAVADMGDDSARLQDLMRWMADDLESSGDYAVAASVVSVLLRLFARHAAPEHRRGTTPAHDLAAAFVESVATNADKRSVAWHAQQIGASTRTLARATAEVLDRRPKEIIDGHVILEARRRLAWSAQDISTIARALSFSEASNFTKFFRSRTGSSPSAFREAIRLTEAAHLS